MRTRDIDLLRVETETLGGDDLYGRPRPRPLAALAFASDGHFVRWDESVPCEIRRRAEIQGVDSGVAGLPSPPRPIVRRFQEALEPLGSTIIEGGPSYVIPREPPVPLSEATALIVSVSKEAAPPILEAMRPDPWWDVEEWRELLAGRLGPWAIGTSAGSVAALCHTSVASPEAAEAGVWTHPAARGNGYAATVTAAWAKVARERFETLFYSTSLENAASQAVARKIGARPIGWTWRVLAQEGEDCTVTR